jgi:hypothetical protein
MKRASWMVNHMSFLTAALVLFASLLCEILVDPRPPCISNRATVRGWPWSLLTGGSSTGWH